MQDRDIKTKMIVVICGSNNMEKSGEINWPLSGVIISKNI